MFKHIQLLHLGMTGRLHNVYAVSVLLQHTALPGGSVWPSPGKKPRQDVGRTVFIAVHDESTICTAIRAFPQRHRLQMFTPATS